MGAIRLDIEKDNPSLHINSVFCDMEYITPPEIFEHIEYRRCIFICNLHFRNKNGASQKW